MEYNKVNLVGYPETNPPLSNSIDARELAVSSKVHYDDNSRHINFGERKKWNESEKSAKDYTDYQFTSIIGQFDFADNTKTLSQILKKEIDDRTRILNQEISDRKAAIAQEQNERTEQINAVNTAIKNEVNARTQAITNEANARSQAIINEVNARMQDDTKEANARSQAISKEQTDRINQINAVNAAINNEANTRSQAISKEQNDRNNQIVSAITAEANARSQADSNESTARVNQFNSLVTHLHDGSIAPLRVNGIRITMDANPPSNPVNNAEFFICTSNGHTYSYYNNCWNQSFAIYK